MTVYSGKGLEYTVILIFMIKSKYKGELFYANTKFNKKVLTLL